MKAFLSIPFIALLVVLSHISLGQNMSINASGAKPDSSAMLDVSSTSQGILIPRMTQAQRNAISNPANGLLIYQITGSEGLYRFDSIGGAWNLLPDSAQVESIGADNLGDHTATQDIVLSGFRISNDGGAEGLTVSNVGQVTATPGTTGAGNLALVTNGDIRTVGQGTGVWFTNYQIGITGNNGNSGDMRFATGSTDRIRLTTGGQIGLGTTNPNYQVSLGSNLSNTKFALWDNGSSNSFGIGAQSSNFIFHLNQAADAFNFYDTPTLTTAVMTVRGNGRVGIGTTNPQGRLHVLDNGGAMNVRFETPDTSGVRLDLINSVRTWRQVVSATGYFRIRDINLLATRLTIDTLGRVGIGTNNPAATLEVVGDGSLLGGARISATTSATVGAALFFNTATTDWTITGTNTSSSSGSDRLVFRNYTGATDIMTLRSTGEVGIGTNNPSAQLDVTGNIEIPASNNYRYATARTEYFSVPAAAFTLIDVSGLGPTEDGFTSGNARWTQGGLGSNDAYMYAPISLPDSAIIQEVIFYVFDNDFTYNVSGELSRHNLGGTVVNDLAVTASTTGQPGTTALNDNTITNATVDNSAYSYFLVFNTKEANSNLRIYGARIEYQIYKAD